MHHLPGVVPPGLIYIIITKYTSVARLCKFWYNCYRTTTYEDLNKGVHYMFNKVSLVTLLVNPTERTALGTTVRALEDKNPS